MEKLARAGDAVPDRITAGAAPISAEASVSGRMLLLFHSLHTVVQNVRFICRNYLKVS